MGQFPPGVIEWPKAVNWGFQHEQHLQSANSCLLLTTRLGMHAAHISCSLLGSAQLSGKVLS